MFYNTKENFAYHEFLEKFQLLPAGMGLILGILENSKIFRLFVYD